VGINVLLSYNSANRTIAGERGVGRVPIPTGDIHCGTLFMYLRAILFTFQISVDFYYVPVGGRGGERGGWRRGGGG
jgi:hypothetical protein